MGTKEKESTMPEIRVLDHDTIDKIAAGEVVERPSSVVKELVENAMDAGSDTITVEIRGGGIDFIRVTDNGCGIPSDQIETAFMRHATSKIRSADDLDVVESLGFRGEALSSIGAVAQIELITKTPEALIGTRYISEGDGKKNCEEIGAPNGTTVMVRNLFYNTPVRRKFLKTATTEGSYIADLMEHLALSHPSVSFKFMVNGTVKFHTSGNGDLKEVIYRIYGRETANELIPLDSQVPGMKLSGYLGKPVMNRSNRSFETYFVNGRYIRSDLLAKALEEGYKEYLMQHKYPFVVLHFDIDTAYVDVNVHPTKMDVRFTDGPAVFDFVASSVESALKIHEMIPDVYLAPQEKEPQVKEAVPEPFEARRMANPISEQPRVIPQPVPNVVMPEKAEKGNAAFTINFDDEEEKTDFKVLNSRPQTAPASSSVIKAKDTVIIEKPVQMDLFEEKLLTKDARQQYRILGQIFDTYWIIAFQDKIFLVDQHAAHEKVRFERFMKNYREKTIAAQYLNPPIIITLTGQEESVLKEYFNYFTELGFEIEDFGGNAYALRAVPTDLYGCSEKQFFTEILDELVQGPVRGTADVVRTKIASMSCKAAVKGNTRFSTAEMEALIDELLTLDNPYNCPHGRPTIVTLSKYEIERKFKRIV